MRRSGERTLHRLGPVLLCALAAHAVVWRSFSPHQDEATYSHAYQPLIGVAALVALAAVTVFAAIALARGHRSPTFVSAALTLAAGAAGWVELQESVERSLSARHLALFEPSAPTGALLLVAALLAALAVTAARHAGAAIVRRLSSRTQFHGRRARPVRVRPAAVCPARRSVLSLCCGLRAPPRPA
jgi:hypothetical protein